VTLLQLFAFLACAFLFGLALRRWCTSRSGRQLETTGADTISDALVVVADDRLPTEA
jgi:hypothetical protein